MQGYDTFHTRDLAFKNSTSDGEINVISLREKRVVITKDSDFFDAFMLRREPFKLLLITTGNINNQDLEILFAKNIGQLLELFQSYSLIEMNRDSLVVHR
jgi:predicted nuclease of predicted toxin-antitoxin system